MRRIGFLAVCALVVWRLAPLYAADTDNVRERLEKAKAADEGKGEALLKDVLQDLEKREGASLLSADPGYSSIPLAFLPPREYILEITLAKIAGNSDFQIGLITGETRCTIVLDGWGGEISGISKVDGRSSNENETTHQG